MVNIENFVNNKQNVFIFVKEYLHFLLKILIVK